MSTATSTLRLILLGEDKSGSKAIKGVGDEAVKSSSKMDKFHKVGAAAGRGLAIGLAAAGAAAVSMTKKASEDEQAASRLANTLKRAAGATDQQVKSTEDWITTQGKAYGVTDDDLRPALARLAVATHDVGKAQKLASLAMDVSAGTGKSLEQVSTALAKAQNGNVAGLARLGIQTKDSTKDTAALERAQISLKSAQQAYTAAVKAHGKRSSEASIAADKLHLAQENVGAATQKTKAITIDAGEAYKRLGDAYGGAASKNAETAAGKQKIMAVQLSELQEKIGYALIPVMSKLVDIGMKVIGWVDRNTKLAGILVAVIGGLAAVTWAVSAATKAWAAITKVATAAQWLWNAAMDANPIALVVLALVALGVGLVIAYKKSATFRAIVQGALHGVLAAGRAVAGFFTHDIPVAFGKVKMAASNAISWVKSHWPLILAILTGPFGLAVLVIAKNWSKIKDGASNAVAFIKGKFGDFISFIASIPGKIIGMQERFLSAGKALGSRIITGLFNGLKAIGGFAGDLAGAIKGAVNSALHLPFTIHGPGPLPDFTIPAFAKGGIVTRPTIGLIGEAGPEAIIPLGRGGGMGGSAGHDLGTVKLELTLDGKTMQTALLRVKRTNGGLALGLA